MSTSVVVQNSRDTNTSQENQDVVLVKQEIVQWETNYSFLLEDKEAIQSELEAVQEKLALLQADYDKCQRELHSQNKNNTVKVKQQEEDTTCIIKCNILLRYYL